MGSLFALNDFTKLEEVFDVKTMSLNKNLLKVRKGKDCLLLTYENVHRDNGNDNRDIVSSVALDLRASRGVYKNGNATSFLNILGWVVDNGTKYYNPALTGKPKALLHPGQFLQMEHFPCLTKSIRSMWNFVDSKAVVIAADILSGKAPTDSITGFFEKMPDELTSKSSETLRKKLRMQLVISQAYCFWLVECIESNEV